MISSAVHSRNFIQGHPLLDRSQVMFRNLYGDEGADLKSAMAREDWKGTDAFIKNGRDWILDQVKKSEIRGRGGAGFSTATKWSFVPKDEEKPHYLIVNADEGEPGTCKDRQILTNEPHKVVEGALLAAYTVRAHSCYVYCRGEFSYEGQRLQKAIDEAYAAGLIGKNNKFGWDFDMYIHFGAGSYICGEETALMNSLMGNPGRPRTKPPFPAAKGLFFCPTIINNVETISLISTICRRGGDWFSSIGVKNAKGTKLFAISGCVNHPCVVEDAMGVSLRELIEKHAGGVKGGWSNLKAIIPGGLSCQMLNPKEANEAIMSYDCLEKYGSSLGTGAIIVIDKDQDIVKTYQRVLEFYRLESCHQCKVCKDGTTKLTELLEKIGNGEGTQSDLKLLEETADKTKNGICWLAQSAGDPVKGLLRNYKQDLVDRLKK